MELYNLLLLILTLIGLMLLIVENKGKSIRATRFFAGLPKCVLDRGVSRGTDVAVVSWVLEDHMGWTQSREF